MVKYIALRVFPYICFLFFSSTIFGQNASSLEIRGLVLDVTNQNKPIEGATLSLLSVKTTMVTDELGGFAMLITADDFKNGILEISAPNYVTRKIRINGRKSFNILLTKDSENNNPNEVVVTSSYKKTIREEIVGSVSTVSAKQLQTDRPIESLDKMLEGMVAGLQVETNTQLGTPVKINIRGQNALSPIRTSNTTALTASSQPLFVIDGIPIMEQRRGDEPIAFLNSEQLLNPLANINPDDIESITVLKDAASASIYGANASNGVILITTKNGVSGKTALNVNYSTGINSPINRLKMLNGLEYQTLIKELYINEGRDPAVAELLAGSKTIDTDWFGLLNQRGSFTDVNADISGGSTNVRYRLSVGYYKAESIQKGNDYTKAFMRLRVDQNLNRKMKFGMQIAPTYTKKNALDTYENAPLLPNMPVYEFDGSFFEPTTLGIPNPLAVLAQNKAVHEGGGLNANLNFDYQILPTLKFNNTVGIDLLINKLNLFDSPKNATGRSKNGFARIYDRTNISWINFSQLNWKPNIGENQKIDFLAGFETQSQSTNLLLGQGTGFTYYRLNELSNATTRNAASSKQKGTSYSIYGMAQYSLKGKYHLNISGRNDAASIFGTDVNTTINAAAGFGWIINKEKLFEEIKWIDVFRLRTSYGTTGNNRIGSYEARGIYTFNSNSYNGSTSASPASLPNPDLTWEKSYKKNIGIDFGFFKKFNFSVDAYENIIKDGISVIRIPAQNGFTEVLGNIANMRNRGLDLSFDLNLKFGKLNWTSRLNAGFNKNIILSVKNNSQIFSSNENATAVKAGASTSAIWGFKFAGVDPNTGGELFYNELGEIVPVDILNFNMANATQLGDRLPKIQGGFINSFIFKDFSIGINLIYNIGGHDLISNTNEAYGRNLDNRNQSVNLLDRWQKAGDKTTIPKLSRSANLVANSSKFVYDNTFLKLSNITLSYAFPKKITDKLRGGQIRVYANGTNLMYWYKSETKNGRNGLQESRFSFPEARSFTFGIKLNIN